MNIIFLADIDPTGGTGTCFLRLHSFLSNSNNVQLILEKRYWSSVCNNTKLIPYIKHHRVEHFIFRIFRKLGFSLQYMYYRDLLLLRNFERKYKPDLFVFSQGGSTKWFSAFKLHSPVFFLIHSLYDTISPQAVNNFLQKQFTDLPKVNNKKIAHVSSFADQQFQKTVFSTQLKAISCSLPNYANKPQESAKQRNNTIFNILTIGHLNGYKNPLLWYNVAKIITEKHNFVHFIWAGDGDYYKELVRQNTNPNIHFLGFQKDTIALYNNADIYFQPSILESQGIAVVEALSYSIPCVVSTAGGLPESIIGGYNGFTCDISDEIAYINAIEQLITNTQLRLDFGTNAYQQYKNNFSQEIWEERMNKTIKDILC